MIAAPDPHHENWGLTGELLRCPHGLPYAVW